MKKPEEKPAPFPDMRAEMVAAVATLPEHVEIPHSMTPEGERLEAFRKVCPPEFMSSIDRSKLPNLPAFDQVAKWSGAYPGPCAFGDTNTGKTRAAWSVVGRLYVKENRSFCWFPVRRLSAEMERYEKINLSDEFFRNLSHYRLLLVDDLDKINWQFDSYKEQLFAFFDWVYRTNKPCVTTTNKDRVWWADRMGDAFARRLFDDAHFGVKF